MVRNRTGGSRHKKLARKNVKSTQNVVKTRLKDPSESCEIYAIITNMYGQGNCEAMCNDGKKRLCIIRKKFRSRNKRSNHVSIGTIVLVGLRDWELLSKDKKEKCDLLEVYNSKQLSDLKKDVNFNATLLKTDEELYQPVDGNSFIFSNKNTTEIKPDDDKISATSEEKDILKELDWADIDDI